MTIASGSRTISVQPGSSIISLRSDELQPTTDTPHSYRYHSDGVHRLYFSEGAHFHQLQFEVDYETNDTWEGPLPSDQPRFLPKFSTKRARREALTIVLLGDSISEGYNASGFTGVAPFQASYGEIFASYVRREGNVVSFTNLSKAGKKAHWGFEQLSKVILARPDLLILAFGMNDATSEVPVTDFINDLSKILRAVRAEIPDCEFVIIAGMSPNPDWNHANRELRTSYREAIMQLRGEGVAVCDVKSVCDFIAEKKGFWSITGNGINHPNDFGHRLYADCLSATVLGSR